MEIREEIISIDRLKYCLHYDPISGIFTWINPPHNHTRLRGCVAGGKSTGYVMIKIDGVKYKAHRLAWLYVHGVEAPCRVDHKDTDTFNNRIENLRLATQAQNIANARRKAGKKLPKGVRANGPRFTARISFEKTLYTLGTFDTPEQASDAYFKAAQHFYGEFARTA